MKNYQSPSCIVIGFSVEDVVRTSGTTKDVYGWLDNLNDVQPSDQI